MNTPIKNWLAACVIMGVTTPSLAQSQNGAVLVLEHCAMCHATGKSGTSPHPAAPTFRRLGNSYDLEKLEEILERGTILPSHPDMPLFKLDRRTAKAVVSYIRSVQD